MGRVVEEDLSRFRCTLELFSRCHGTAGRKLVSLRCDEDLTCRHRGADFEEDAVLREESVVQYADPVAELVCCANRPESVVFVRGRDPEDREDRLATDARADSSMTLDRDAGGVVVAIEDGAKRLGVEGAGERRRVGELCPQNGHRLARRPWSALRLGRTGARRTSGSPKRGILSQNGTFELLQLLARIDAELVDEDPACVLVGGEGFRLAARPVEREHELCTRTLAIAMRRHERLELNDDVRVATQLELGLDEILARRQLELLEASDGGVGERLESEVGERGPSEQPECVAELLRPLGRTVAACLRDEPLEARDVDLVAVDLEGVAAWTGADDLPTE